MSKKVTRIISSIISIIEVIIYLLIDNDHYKIISIRIFCIAIGITWLIEFLNNQDYSKKERIKNLFYLCCIFFLFILTFII
jgi:hypothetical protein